MIIHRGWHFPEHDTLLRKQTNSDYPNSTYQQEVFDNAIKFVKKFNVAIDVGANIGLHSTRLSKLFTNVYSFEPVQTNFECLEVNLKQFSNVTIYKNGLGEKEFETDIMLTSSHSHNCGAYSINKFVDSDEETVKETISVKTLDSYNLKPDFIKIDTEGYEMSVLEGAYNTLKTYQPVILAEVAKKGPIKKVLDYLKPFGYELSFITNSDKVFSVPK